MNGLNFLYDGMCLWELAKEESVFLGAAEEGCRIEAYFGVKGGLVGGRVVRLYGWY